MLEDLRKYVELGLGMLSPARAREALQALTGAEGQADWAELARKGRERFRELVQTEVGRQIETMGFATQDEVERLRERVRQLEDAAARPRSSGRGAAGGQTPKSSAKARPSGGKATARTGTSTAKSRRGKARSEPTSGRKSSRRSPGDKSSS